MELHDQYKSLLTVSDESVIFHNMSFGWVLATPDENLLAYGAGPCNGRGSSLRSEGAGMLTLILFLSLILEYTGNDGAKLQCISDNQELINRMTEHNKYEYPFPNETTKSEFNITEQIFTTLRNEKY